MKEKIVNNDKYTYNSQDDVYVVPMKHRVKPYVVKGYKIRAIKKAVSNFISPSISGFDIKAKFGIQSEDFEAIKKAFDLTRDTLPLSDEEISDESIEQSVEKLLEEKRTGIIQTYEKISWKNTQEDANRWRDFVDSQVDPFQVALESWNPPKGPAIPKLPRVVNHDTKNVLVVGLADLHWGCASNAKYMFNKGGWDSDKTTTFVDNYSEAVLESAADRTYKFKKVAVFIMGDILHSVSGKTCRGTELKYDVIREEMFEMAMSGLSRFIATMAANFVEVEVHTVGGNHNYEAEVALYRALEAYFRTEKAVKFFNYTTRPAALRLENTLFFLDHGQDSAERAYVPLADNKLETHVQKLMLLKPELLVGINSVIFAMGDRHHFRYDEFDNFDFLMFSTSVLSDEHAATNNLNNRARQSCLVIDKTGVKEIIHFYVDSLLK